MNQFSSSFAKSEESTPVFADSVIWEYPAVECACSRAASKGRYISVEMYSSGRDVKADLSYS